MLCSIAFCRFNFNQWAIGVMPILRHDIVTDSDGTTRHGVMRFSLLISEVV